MDKKVSLETMVKSAELVEKSSVKIISRAGHFPHQERSEYVNEVISKFLIGNYIAHIIISIFLL